MKPFEQHEGKKYWNSEFIIGGISIAIGTVVYFSTRDLSRLGGVFVDYVLVAIFSLAVLVLIKGVIRPEFIKFFDSVIERNNVLVGISILLLYLIILPIIGFLPASYLFYFCFNLYLAEERFTRKNIISSVILTVIVVTLFYYIFNGFLEVPLPRAMWSD